MSTSNNDEPERRSANREKQLVALWSVLAAVLLTGMKLVVGLTTGSLGILSEAAHSGLDLIAAGMTLLAVRVSSRPADREHTYGHAKVENLSALFETVLLLVTCLWIIYEAVQRLFFKSVQVEASLWAFAIMAVSIGVDTTRSRALARAAKKHHSQALEADALHFSTDIWSSSVVIGGLLLVRLAEWWHIQWLAGADAAAAIGVAGIVVYVSVQMGGKTISALLDAIPSGLRDEVVGAVRQVPGVLGVEQVRVRRTGAEAFADIRLGVARDTSLERAHTIAASAEESVHGVLPGADVTVHVDPVRTGEEAAMTTVRMLAAQHGMGAHSIYLYGLGGQSPAGARLRVELHLEVNDALRVDEAHQQASAFEKALRRALPGLGQIVTHIEPVSGTDTLAARKASAADRARVAQALREWEAGNGQTCHPHQLVVQRLEGRLVVSLHCEMDGSTNLADAHSLSEQVEQALRNRLPDLERVVVHIEPADRQRPTPAT